jgi:hypothetical protein
MLSQTAAQRMFFPGSMTSQLVALQSVPTTPAQLVTKFERYVPIKKKL